MDDVVHGAARTLDGPFECVHGSRDMLFKRVGYEHVIVLRITVIRTGPRKIVDPIVRVVAAASWRLLSEKFRNGADERGQPRDLAKETASSIVSHEAWSPFSDKSAWRRSFRQSATRHNNESFRQCTELRERSLL